MEIMEMFHEGGFGMYPTLVFGLLLLGVAVRYAIEPSKRFVPLLAALGVLSISSGTLGFVTGVIKSIQGMQAAKLDNLIYPVFGAGEALNCVALSLMCVTLAALTAAVGAWKLSRDTKAPIAA
jgi:hypothetical protein